MYQTKTRTRISAAEREQLWQRWRQGESISAISRALSRTPPSIRDILLRHGGISPPQRVRAERALRLAEREAISRGLSAGQSMRAIARLLQRPPSTISREIQRHGGRDQYRAHQADQAAWQRSGRPKPCKLAMNTSLRHHVASKLKRNWSPDQIAQWLKGLYPDAVEMRVSPETIYRSLYVQARGIFKKELIQHLRLKHKMRRGKRAVEEKRGEIPDLVSIRERPAEVEDRGVPGHWEGDLIAGSNGSYIATLGERQTRYVMLAKVRDKTTNAVVSALIKQAKKLPEELYQSLTWDRGAELKSHRRFTIATDIDVYFCDPGSPWQRGSNENTNGLLRQYFPKGTDLSEHSQRRLNYVARELNERPRKTLGYQTPADRFAACVAMTD